MNFLKNSNFILGLYVIIAIAIALQQYSLGSYNNFTIFQNAVFHFFAHKNPYLAYPDLFHDVFLYNPSFVIFFIPFAYLPTALGMVVWQIFILVFYFLAIKSLPIDNKWKLFIFYLIVPELITSMGHLQSNPLIAAFTVLSMTLLDKNEFKKAFALPALNFFIKGYGGIAGIFFLLKNPKFINFVYIFFSFVFIGILPLLFYSFDEFIVLYQQWFTSLGNDYAINVGTSAMAVIKTLIYEDVSVPAIQLTGVAIFFGTFFWILFRKTYELVKLDFLANVLIWMIIFNQSSESPTYIIASTGAFIWFVNSKKTHLDIALFVFFFILTVMSPSDLFPKYIRETYVLPYSLKALPCVLIWIKIQFNLILTSQTPETIYEKGS
jgi:hypothetical protein